MLRTAILPMSILATPALAQENDAPGDTEATRPAAGTNEIVVVAERLRDQVDAPQPPVVVYGEEDIAAFGASSIGDLVTAAAPQTGSGRGRGGGHPVILFNGQRISNFREMRNIPPEAIRRMEVLPEEVALRFGYSPDQRVINFILRDNFAAKSVTAEYHFPTLGGFSENQFEGTILKINKSSRLNLYARANDASPLTEADRGVVQQEGTLPTVSTDPDPAQFRTLIADTKDYIVNGSWTKGLGDKGLDGSIGLNAGFTRNDNRSFSGLNTVLLTAPDGSTAIRTLGDPLMRRSRVDTIQGGATLNKPLGDWQLTATVDATHAVTTSHIDRRADLSGLVTSAAAGSLSIAGPLPAPGPTQVDRAKAKNDSVTSLVTFAGKPFHLPAGDVAATFKAGFAYTGIDSEDTRTSAGPSNLRRGDLSTGINLSLPLTSRRNQVLAGAGDISLNLSAGLNRLSDFGTLKDWSAGLTWAPTEKLSLQASYIVNEAAPSLTDLGNPQIVTFNVPVYDFTRGETALVTVTGGGNPALVREKQRDLKLSANWQLPFLSNSNLIVEYFRNHSSDVTASFPLLTPVIEAAFPGRVTRDASGRLVAIDRRPVTFAETTGARLRWGFNLSGSLGKAPPRGESGGGVSGGGTGQGMGPPGGMGAGPGGGRGFGRFMGGRGGGQGRWNLSLYHTVRFTDRVLIAPGVPELDLLGGDATSGSGSARHGLELEGGTFYKGMGLRLKGSWAAPTHVRGSGLPGSTDLRFGSVFNLDLRAFVNFDQKPQIVKALPFLKGSRLAIEVENLFESRQRVTDASGLVPLSYQPDLIDPRGRIIQISFRKMF